MSTPVNNGIELWFTQNPDGKLITWHYSEEEARQQLKSMPFSHGMRIAHMVQVLEDKQ